LIYLIFKEKLIHENVRVRIERSNPPSDIITTILGKPLFLSVTLWGNPSMLASKPN
jgi:hypothetical protein